MKENELNNKNMRTDYDALVSSGQRTMVEVKRVSEIASHTSILMEKLQEQVENKMGIIEEKQMEG